MKAKKAGPNCPCGMQMGRTCYCPEVKVKAKANTGTRVEDVLLAYELRMQSLEVQNAALLAALETVEWDVKQGALPELEPIRAAIQACREGK